MKIILILVVLLFAAIGNAVPLKYYNCEKSKEIKEPTQSQGYVMDSACSTVYVKPPIEGSIKISSFSSLLDDGACKNIMSNMNLLNRSIARNEAAVKELEKAQKELNKNNKKIEKLKSTCDEDRSYIGNIQIYKSKIGEDLRQFQQELDDLNKNLATCDGAKANCYRLKYQKERLETQIEKISSRTKKIDHLLNSTNAKLKACDSYVNSEVARIKLEDKDYSEAFEKLQAENEGLVSLLNEKSDSLMKQVGGELAIGLFSKHNRLVQEFESLNKNLDLDFRPMPLQNAVLHFDRIEDGLKAGFPVQLRSSINGLKAPSDSKDGIPADDLAGVTQDHIAFGEGAGGTIVINRYTACSLITKYPASSGEERLQAIADTLKPTVTFAYDVQVKRDINIKYNESYLYQLIKRSSSKSGLFRSSSSSSLTEKSESNKWIQIQIASEDERLKFENPEKLMMDLRSEFLDSALMKVAKGYLTSEQLRLREPGANGATQVAKELRRSCPYAYCQYAAVALDIGSALFGRSVSEDNMSRSVEAQQWEHYSDIQTVREFGQQTLTVVKD